MLLLSIIYYKYVVGGILANSSIEVVALMKIRPETETFKLFVCNPSKLKCFRRRYLEKNYIFVKIPVKMCQFP